MVQCVCCDADATIVQTLSMETIRPLNGCSPVGSMQLNLAPKSLKAELGTYQSAICKKRACKPKEATGFRGHEVDTVLARPGIDLELLRQRTICQDDDLCMEWVTGILGNIRATCLKAFELLGRNVLARDTASILDRNICVEF